MRRLQSSRAVWIPKRIVGKSFINNLRKKNPTLKIPEEATNEIFSLILEPNEILGPFPFERWVQSSTAVARKFVKDIYTIYYKPPFHYASTIKLEFHKDHLPHLPHILTTIKNQYMIHNKQISPIMWAHTLAKSEILDVNKLNAAIQKLAIIQCIDPKLKTIIQARFSNFNF